MGGGGRDVARCTRLTGTADWPPNYGRLLVPARGRGFRVRIAGAGTWCVTCEREVSWVDRNGRAGSEAAAAGAGRKEQLLVVPRYPAGFGYPARGCLGSCC